jgi:hypothetical protein
VRPPDLLLTVMLFSERRIYPKRASAVLADQHFELPPNPAFYGYPNISSLKELRVKRWPWVLGEISSMRSTGINDELRLLADGFGGGPKGLGAPV